VGYFESLPHGLQREEFGHWLARCYLAEQWYFVATVPTETAASEREARSRLPRLECLLSSRPRLQKVGRAIDRLYHPPLSSPRSSTGGMTTTAARGPTSTRMAGQTTAASWAGTGSTLNHPLIFPDPGAVEGGGPGWTPTGMGGGIIAGSSAVPSSSIARWPARSRRRLALARPTLRVSWIGLRFEPDMGGCQRGPGP
jgi:hypothetical protein